MKCRPCTVFVMRVPKSAYNSLCSVCQEEFKDGRDGHGFPQLVGGDHVSVSISIQGARNALATLIELVEVQLGDSSIPVSESRSFDCGRMVRRARVDGRRVACPEQWSLLDRP